MDTKTWQLMAASIGLALSVRATPAALLLLFFLFLFFDLYASGNMASSDATRNDLLSLFAIDLGTVW
jgi:hypothetical protein